MGIKRKTGNNFRAQTGLGLGHTDTMVQRAAQHRPASQQVVVSAVQCYVIGLLLALATCPAAALLQCYKDDTFSGTVEISSIAAAPSDQLASQNINKMVMTNDSWWMT